MGQLPKVAGIAVALLLSPFARADMNQNKNIQMTIRFYYDQLEDSKDKVLYFERIYRNVSNKPVTFSLYSTFPMIKEIEPKSSYKMSVGTYRGATGRPPPPHAHDIVRLNPGESKTAIRWDWASGVLPFPLYDLKGEHFQNFNVKDKTKIKVTVVDTLAPLDLGLENLLKPGETLEQGTLEATAAPFEYRITNPLK